MTERPASTPRRNRDLVVAAACGVVVAVMVGASYAAVPLYDWFCRTTGFGGTHAGRDSPRRRDCSTASSPCASTPMSAPACRGASRRRSTEIEVRIGEVVTVDLHGHQPRRRARRSAMPSYNVDAAERRRLFPEDQCFCFTEQRLGAGEKRDMPVVFYVDPALVADPRAGRSRRRSRLSYTFFPVRNPSQPVAAAGRQAGGTTVRMLKCARARADSRRTALDGDVMATAHAKHHDYHLVDPSPWPIVGSISASDPAPSARSPGCTTCSPPAPFVFGVGVLGVLYTMVGWWRDVIREAQYKGDHTRVVQLCTATA